MVEEPDVVLENDVDIVITNESMYVLKIFALETLGREYSFSKKDILEHAEGLEMSLKGKMDLSEDAVNILSDAASRKVSVAKRIRNMRDHVDELDIDLGAWNDALVKHGIQNDLTISESNEVVINEMNVELFLDLLEGRLFEQDFTGVDMRADRLRPRLGQHK